MAKTKDGFYKQFNSQTGLNSNILLAGGGTNPLTASNENLGCVKVASVSSDVSNADTTITDNKYALHLDRYGLAYVAIPSDTKVSYESNSSNLYHPILFANNTSSTGDPSPGSIYYESNTIDGNGLTYNPYANTMRFPVSSKLTTGTSDTSGNGLTAKLKTIYALTTSNGTAYGVGSAGLILKSNGTNVYWNTQSNATTTEDGFMSAEDKTKLDGITVTINTGTDNKLSYYSGTDTIDDYTSTKGSTTKGVYLNAGVPTEMTYSLSSTVNSGTISRLAYYSGANAISSLAISASTSTLYVLGVTSGGHIPYSATQSTSGVRISSGTTLYASGGFYESSDNKLKNFKENIEINFDKLKQLPKKYFTWKSDETNKLNIGTSAQELQKLYPELVSEDENGLLHVAYDKLSIIALSAIDKLYEEVCELKSIINSLQNK